MKEKEKKKKKADDEQEALKKDWKWHEKVRMKKEKMKEDYVHKWFKDCHTHKVVLKGENEEGPYHACQYSVELNPLQGNEHKYTLILLHGLGDNGVGFYEWITMIKHDFFGNPGDEDADEKDNTYDLMRYCRILLPCAPEIKVKSCYNDDMNAWFNYDFGFKEPKYRGNLLKL